MELAPVSIIIPTHNRAHLIGRAIDSVLAAMSAHDEVIVVDDGSTDDTPRVLATYGDRIRVIANRRGGAGKARNLGVAHACRPLIAFLDSDDEWMPDKLAVQRPFMTARPDVLFCFSDFTVRSKGQPDHPHYLINWHDDHRPWDEILGPRINFSSIAPLPPGRPDFRVYVGDLYRTLMRRFYVQVGTTLIRRAEAGAALHYAEDLPTYEDWECTARLARAGRAAYLECDTIWNWGHEGPRLTDARQLTTCTTHLALLERLWGSDAAFLRQYRAEYEALLGKVRLSRAEALIAAGRTREARQELHQVGGGPLAHRLLAGMPGPLARGLVHTRRTLGRLIRRR